MSMRVAHVLRHNSLVVICLIGLHLSLGAQTTPTGQNTNTAITTAVPFMLINPDSRGAGLGDAGVAIADNANALYWNPAAMAFFTHQYGVSVNFTPWLRAIIPDINHFYIPGYYNLGEKGGVVGGSLTYFSLGRIQFTDINAISQGEFQANEFALSGSYARKLTKNMSIGASLRYIRSDLAGSSTVGAVSLNPGQSVAGDVALFYKKDFNVKTGGTQLPMTFSWGLNISNIGAKMNYSGDDNRRFFLPTNLRLGTALKAQLDEYNSVLWTVDFNKLLVPSTVKGSTEQSVIGGLFGSFTDTSFAVQLKQVTIGTGVEYWYNDLFAARVGYFYENPDRGGRQFLSLGFGLKYQIATFDFAFLQPLVQNNPLQNTLRFSIGFNIGDTGTRAVKDN